MKIFLFQILVFNNLFITLLTLTNKLKTVFLSKDTWETFFVFKKLLIFTLP